MHIGMLTRSYINSKSRLGECKSFYVDKVTEIPKHITCLLP